MRDLFLYDLKDYNPAGKVLRRPSVRGIVVKEGKVLLIYSQKYDYYKFPGGGIEKGEDHVNALVREVQEESGYIVIPDSVVEFGRVLRRQKDSLCEDHIFEQENFYYFCEIKDTKTEVSLDDYEREEGFTPIWMEPFEASWHNRYCRNKGGDPRMIEREEKVLDLVDLELRGRVHEAHEAATIEALGNPEYADMLAFVRQTLEEVCTENKGTKTDIYYSRFEHTKRVLGWAKRLYDMSDCRDELSYEDIIIATIFHDVGRGAAQGIDQSHAHAGVPITREYLLSHGFEAERTEYICSLVAGHSDKYRMQEPDLDKNLLLLMEADFFDETGANGIILDCMVTESRNPKAQFVDCLDHISRYTWRMHQENPMVSAAARKLWEQKTQLVQTFVTSLQEDLIL